MSWWVADRPQRAQLAHLHRLALHVLQVYPLRVTSVRFLTGHWNTIFRVDTASGERFVLRISRPNIYTGTEILSELWWLQALHRETHLHVPQPVSARDGALLVTLNTPDQSEIHQCALFTWAGGRRAANPPARSLARRMGIALALLHAHADGLTLPSWFTRKRMDTVWTFGQPAFLTPNVQHPILRPRLRDLVIERGDEAQRVLDRLYADPSGLRLCHFDLHLSNVKVEGKTLHVLDFDDCAMCFPVQDLAVSLYAFYRASTDPEPVCGAFLDGYTSVRPLPALFDEVIDPLIDTRVVDLVSYWVDSPEWYRQTHLAGSLEASESLLMRTRRWSR